MKFPFKNLCSFPVEHYPMGDVPKVALGYASNAYGYRCGAFDSPADLNVITLGDEWTEGLGVAASETYAEIACDNVAEVLEISVNNWNMGHRGKGYDFIARIVMCAMDVLKPDLVLIVLPSAARREFFALDGKLIDFSSENIEALADENGALSLIERDLLQYYAPLQSDYDDLSWAILNYKLIEEILNANGVRWAISCNGDVAANMPFTRLARQGWLDQSKYLGVEFELTDRAPDQPYLPGPESHKIFATHVAEWMVDNAVGISGNSRQGEIC